MKDLPVNADTFALVEVGFSVSCGDALCVAGGDETVENVGDHLEFGSGCFDLSRADGRVVRGG